MSKVREQILLMRGWVVGSRQEDQQVKSPLRLEKCAELREQQGSQRGWWVGKWRDWLDWARDAEIYSTEDVTMLGSPLSLSPTSSSSPLSMK